MLKGMWFSVFLELVGVLNLKVIVCFFSLEFDFFFKFDMEFE